MSEASGVGGASGTNGPAGTPAAGGGTGIDDATVEHIARLARIHLSPEELPRFGAQLQSILSFFRTLQEVDTTGVEPLVHAVEAVNVLAGDEPKTSLSREQALRGAPDQDGRFFCVPRILGDQT